jgi:hypothetical protein
MRKHRNPRPRLPKQPSTHNPTQVRREMSAAFRALIRLNPQAASAVLDLVEMVANSNRQRLMRLLEIASLLVHSIRGGR